MVEKFKVGIPVWTALALVGCFVLWAFRAESSLDKRVTVIEENNKHSATKADLAPIETSIAVIQNTVERIEKHQKEIGR